MYTYEKTALLTTKVWVRIQELKIRESSMSAAKKFQFWCLKINLTNIWFVVCDSDLGMVSAFIPDAWISASSEPFYSQAFRARLNETYDSFNLQYGAWIPDTDDTNQWIQVEFQEEHRYTAIWLQGRQDDANWVTSFSIQLGENTTSLTNYTAADGSVVR